MAVLLAVAAVAEFVTGVGALTRLRTADGVAAPAAAHGAAPRVAPAPLPDGADADDRAAAVRGLLDHRATALLHRDRAGWLAGIDPRATAFRTSESTVFDNLAAVPLAGWQYAVEPGASRALPAATLARYGGEVWVPQVTLRYGLRGVDAELTDRPELLTFVRRAGRWYLAADGDVATDGTRSWRGLWDFGRVVARRGRSSLVLAHPGNAGRLATFVAAADAAVPRVSAVWGTGWSRAVALLIPDDAREMSQLVGSRFALARIAAVSIADYADPRTDTARGQRVVINPANLDRLGPTGRRIVLQHEITHVASRGVTGPGMPTWLVEGFADYVGYRDSGLPVPVIGQELHAAVRHGGWPGRLPADADFRGDSPGLAVAYEEAWFACLIVAGRVGIAGLVRLYRLVGTSTAAGPAAVDAALRQVLHESTAQFIAEWKHDVQTELR